MRKTIASVLLLVCISANTVLGGTIRVLVTSESEQKIRAVERAFEKSFTGDAIEVIAFAAQSLIPNQPIGEAVAKKGAENRIHSLPQELIDSSDYIVSIENFVASLSSGWVDRGLVLLKNQEKEEVLLSRATLIPTFYVEKAMEHSEMVSSEGFSCTVGEIIQASLPQQAIEPRDWHREEMFGGVSREALLEEAIFKALHMKEISLMKDKIALHQDFPKKGILFEDFFPLLNDPVTLKQCVDLLYDRYRNEKIEGVVGLESRGFILGSVLAYKLGVGFTPVRKPGKLPGETLSVSYQKEYGEDTLVISREALKPHQRILIVDDLIATGGSARAAIQLVQNAGATPVEFVSLLEVKDLNGRADLGIPSFNLLD